MYERIMVPLDGSPFAEEALPLAHLLAQELGAELHLVHVIHASPDFALKTPAEDLAWEAFAKERATAYLDAKAEEARASGVSTRSAVLEGHVAAALEAYAEEATVGVTVLTTHGRGGVRRWWIGSVTDDLVRRGRTDLLLVRPWDETGDLDARTSRFETIVVPLDGSDVAEAALGPALRLADAFASELVLLQVVPSPVELTSIYGVPGVELRGEGHDLRLREARTYLEAVALSTGRPRVETLALESGGAADGIVDAARTRGADLIALASHGRGGLKRAVLGSVTDKVLRATTRPVLIARAPTDQAAKGSKP